MSGSSESDGCDNKALPAARPFVDPRIARTSPSVLYGSRASHHVSGPPSLEMDSVALVLRYTQYGRAQRAAHLDTKFITFFSHASPASPRTQTPSRIVFFSRPVTHLLRNAGLRQSATLLCRIHSRACLSRAPFQGKTLCLLCRACSVEHRRDRRAAKRLSFHRDFCSRIALNSVS